MLFTTFPLMTSRFSLQQTPISALLQTFPLSSLISLSLSEASLSRSNWAFKSRNAAQCLSFLQRKPGSQAPSGLGNSGWPKAGSSRRRRSCARCHHCCPVGIPVRLRQLTQGKPVWILHRAVKLADVTIKLGKIHSLRLQHSFDKYSSFSQDSPDSPDSPDSGRSKMGL